MKILYIIYAKYHPVSFNWYTIFITFYLIPGNFLQRIKLIKNVIYKNRYNPLLLETNFKNTTKPQNTYKTTE